MSQILPYRGVNPFAPVGYQGTPNGAPGGYFDVGHDYVFNLPVIAANATLVGLVGIDVDSDFVLRLILNNDAAALLRFRFQDAARQYLSSDFIFSQCYNTVVFPELLFPAGGKIGVEVQEVGGVGTTNIQVVFRGARRYRMPT